eukprot:Sspe_Gene.35220::Locus_17085_Transcript_1_1_Confidence_1.000_Length_4720::g.35220::m.35220
MRSSYSSSTDHTSYDRRPRDSLGITSPDTASSTPKYLKGYTTSFSPAPRPGGSPARTSPPRSPFTLGRGSDSSSWSHKAHLAGSPRRSDGRLSVDDEYERKKRALEESSVSSLKSLEARKLQEERERTSTFLARKKEIEEEGKRVARLEAELRVQRQRSSLSDQRAEKCEVDQLKMTLLQQRVKELELELSACTADRNQLKARRSELEEKVLELQNTSSTRLLEGKLSALNAMVSEKTADLEQERAKSASLAAKLEDMRLVLTHQSSQQELWEKETGHKAIEVERAKQEVERLGRRVHELEAELQVNVQKALRMEEDYRGKLAAKEGEAEELRNEMRSKNRHFGQVEVAHMELQDVVAKHEAKVASLEEQLRKRDEHIARAETLLQQREQDCERLHADLAQRDALMEGLRGETHREVTKVNELTRELRAAENARHEMELQVHELEAVAGRKEAIEEQVKVLQGCLDRNDQDLKAEVARHNTSKRRIEELEGRLAQMVLLQNRLKDCEAEIMARSETIEAMKAKSDQREEAMEELRRELQRSVDKCRRMQVELQQAIEIKTEVERRASDLELESMRNSSLEGKIKGLETMIESKDAEIKRLHDDVDKYSARTRELELQCDGVDGVKAQLVRAHDDLAALEKKLLTAEQERGDAEQIAEREMCASAKLREALDISSKQREDLEEQLADMKVQAGDRVVYEERIAELHSTSHKQADELAMANAQLEMKEPHLRRMEKESEEWRERASELEALLQARNTKLEEVTAELGAKTVILEKMESDTAGLRRELEWKEQQAELAKEQSSRLTQDLSSKKDQVAALEEREARRSKVVDDQQKALDETESRLAAAKGELAAEQERSLHLEARVLAMEESKNRATVLEGKLAEMERSFAEKNNELSAKEHELIEVKMKVKELEVDAARSRQMQEMVTTLKEQIARQADTIDRLEQEDTKKSITLVELRRELQSREDVCTAQAKRIDDELQRYKEVSAKCHSLEEDLARYAGCEGRVAGLEANLLAKQRDLDNAVDHSKALQAKVQQLERMFADRQSDVDRMSSLQDQLQTKVELIQRLELEADRQKQHHDSLRAELDMQAHKLRMADEEMQRSLEARHDLECRLRDVENEAEERLRQAREEARATRSEATKASSEVQSMHEKLVVSNTSVELLNERLRGAQEEVNKLRQSVSKLEEEKGRCHVEVIDIRGRLEEERAEHSLAKKQLGEMRGRLEEMEVEMCNKEGKTTAIENRLTADVRLKDQQLENHTTVIRELRKQISELGFQLREKDDLAKQDRERATTAERKLRSMQDEVDRLRAVSSSASNDLQAHSVRTSALQAAKDELVASLNAKEGEITSATSAIAALQRQLAAEEARANALQKQLRAQSDEIGRAHDVGAERDRQRLSKEQEYSKRIDILESERAGLEQRVRSLTNELEERRRLELDRERQYGTALASMQSRCNLANGTLGQFEECSAVNAQLRDENRKLLSDNTWHRDELERSREQILELQSQLTREKCLRMGGA